MALSTRDKLIAEATRLLDKGGAAAVTLREVGKAAGVSHNAPYRHFADKDELLAVIAARELQGFGAGEADGDELPSAKALAHAYVDWARCYPERFKLTFGRWTTEHEELAAAATGAHIRLVEAVAAAQQRGELPKGDPERTASLLLALAHGAADLALAGHLQRGGKGAADPEDLVEDLFAHLARSAARR